MKIITIDGSDTSGKSTIIGKVFKKTNGTVMIMDRSISSWHFFNELTGRVPEKDRSWYKKQYNAKVKDFRKIVDLSILLTVEEEDWIERCEEHKEPELIGSLSFIEHQREIERYFNKAKYKNVLKLNTSHTTIDSCVNNILERL